MKIWMLLFSLTGFVVVQAQEFKPYKVESGKIVYEKIRYLTRSVFKFENGVETGSSEQIPYVAEQVIYYWDEFGDVAFEETYQVSEFGGELLPEKVKIAERLWLGEHRYYFNFEENKVSDDPYYMRIKCKENFQYYQIIGSWIETLNLGVEKSGTKEILGKQADYYKISKSSDLYAWKELVLKSESFYYTPKGKRLHPHFTKIAIEIDTVSEIKEELFHPIWIKRRNFFNSLGEQKIVGLIDGRQDVLEQADNIEGFELQKNDILLFVTSKLTIGKMHVLAIDKDKQLIIKYSLYNYGEIIDGSDSFKIKNNADVNIDSPFVKDIASKDLDFKWSVTNKALLFPLNGNYSLLKPSRTTTLKIKEYQRKYK